MNYVYDPAVQALMVAGDPKRNITGIYYIPPVVGAKAEALKFNPSAANNTLISRPRRCTRMCTPSIRRRSRTRST